MEIGSFGVYSKTGDYHSFIKNPETGDYICNIFYLDKGKKETHPKKLYFSQKAFDSAVHLYRNAVESAIKTLGYKRNEKIEKKSDGGEIKKLGDLIPEARTKYRITRIMNLVVQEINKNLSKENFITFETENSNKKRSERNN